MYIYMYILCVCTYTCMYVHVMYTHIHVFVCYKNSMHWNLHPCTVTGESVLIREVSSFQGVRSLLTGALQVCPLERCPLWGVPLNSFSQRLLVYIYIHVHVHTLYTHVYACHVCTYTCHVHTCTCIYIYIHVHVYTCTYMYCMYCLSCRYSQGIMPVSMTTRGKPGHSTSAVQRTSLNLLSRWDKKPEADSQSWCLSLFFQHSENCSNILDAKEI